MTNIINKARNAYARFDQDNPAKKTGLATSESERSHATKLNTIDAALEATNAVVAGTPISWGTGPLTIAWGVLKGVGGLLESITGGWVGNANKGAANMRSGGKSIIAGTTAMIPIVGTWVNGAFAIKDGADALNNAIPGGKLKEPVRAPPEMVTKALEKLDAEVAQAKRAGAGKVFLRLETKNENGLFGMRGFPREDMTLEDAAMLQAFETRGLAYKVSDQATDFMTKGSHYWRATVYIGD